MTATTTDEPDPDLADAIDAPPFDVHPAARADGSFHLVVVPRTRADANVLRNSQTSGAGFAGAELQAARDAFFAVGSGADFRALVQRVRDAEAAAVDAEREAAKLRERLDTAIRDDDDMPTIEKTERALGTATTAAARLAARLPVLKAERDRLRPAVAAGLKAELVGALTDLRSRTEAAEADARRALAVAVSELFPAWLAVARRRDSIVMANEVLGRLSRVD
jgi:hypothetical protein